MTVHTNFIVIGLGDYYKVLSSKQSFEQRVNFTDRFSSIFGNNLSFNQQVNTKSNLTSKVFYELCDMFRLNKEFFKEFDKDINQLVNVRNRIAHGENGIVPTRDNVINFSNAVTNAFDALLDEVRFLVEKKPI
jgi:hypothetical protein